MQKSDNTRTAVKAHRRIQSSTTLNRRYVKKPVLSGDVTVSTKRSPKVRHFANTTSLSPTMAKQDNISPAVQHPMQKEVNKRMHTRMVATRASGATFSLQSGPSAREIKEQAIRKAIASAGAVETEQRKETRIKGGLHFGFGRIVLALSCAALVAFAIVYFVNLNMPDLSLRVAAMQTGINASYPGYVPRDFGTSGISSEEGKVVLDFRSNSGEDKFTIIEEVSSWDSSALLANYVKDKFGENYTVVREQGLTIYISNSSAAWVNGGILYKINAENGVLTNKQIRSIAVSL